MTTKLFYKLGNMGDLTAFCLFSISQEISFISVVWGNEDGNNKEAVGREGIVCLGEKAEKWIKSL